MHAQFIYYKSTFLNLDLRYKLIKDFIRLLYIYIYTYIYKNSSRSTQPNPRPNALSSLGLEEIVGSIRLDFSQAKHVGLAWKNNETQPNPADKHPYL